MQAAADRRGNRDQDPGVRTLGVTLLGRVDALGADLADALERLVPHYRDSDAVPSTELRTSCVENLRYVFQALAGDGDLELAAAEESGRRRAHAGVPLASLLAAYRIGFRHIWENVVTEGRATQVDTATLLTATELAVAAHDAFAHAASVAHAAVVAETLVRHEERRAALVDALLSGHLADAGAVNEVAGLLGLGLKGPYVAVSIDVTELGRPPMPSLDHYLRARGLASVWLLRREQQVGLVEIAAGRLDTLLERLEQLATTPVGVSAPFDALVETPEAVRAASIARQSRATAGWVRVFEDSPLAIAALGSPDVMQRVARSVFARLDRLRPADREPLIQTLTAWLDAGGSTSQAAEALFLHPNTVRQRLRRLEELTARSTADPRQVAELCLALEVRRRWPPDEEPHPTAAVHHGKDPDG
jgi:hypothetical protein